MVTHQDTPRFSNSDPPGSGWYFPLDLFPLDMYGNRQPPQKCEHVRFWWNSMINQAQMISLSGFQVVHCYFLCVFVFFLWCQQLAPKKPIKKRKRNPFLAKACVSVCLPHTRHYPDRFKGADERCLCWHTTTVGALDMIQQMASTPQTIELLNTSRVSMTWLYDMYLIHVVLHLNLHFRPLFKFVQLNLKTFQSRMFDSKKKNPAGTKTAKRSKKIHLFTSAAYESSPKSSAEGSVTCVESSIEISTGGWVLGAVPLRWRRSGYPSTQKKMGQRWMTGISNLWKTMDDGMHSTTSIALLYVDHGDYFRSHYIL